MGSYFIPLSAAGLVSRICGIPRVRLARLPTVLVYAPHISSELYINLFIFWDDCTALAFGGDPTGLLVFIMAWTFSVDYDCIFTGAASPSYFCRLAVAAAH
jgi:1-aminocyclopropane-1-carboxylate deaminase